jgi:hypothetical protein
MKHDVCSIEEDRVARADVVFIIYGHEQPPSLPESVIANAVPKVLFVHPKDVMPGLQSKYSADRIASLPFKRSEIVEILEEISARIQA